MLNPDLKKQIQSLVNSDRVVLFMKGSKDQPACGFSAKVVDVLKELDVDFADVDILLDEDLRQGIKVFSDWPTFPQLYVDQELVGGCDIIQEMYIEGELEELIFPNEN